MNHQILYKFLSISLTNNNFSIILIYCYFTEYLPVKNGKLKALGSHVAQSSHPMNGVLVTIYKVMTMIVCFTILSIALEMRGSRFCCEKLILLFFFKSTTPDILLLFHTAIHIFPYVYTSTIKGNRNCTMLYL